MSHEINTLGGQVAVSDAFQHVQTLPRQYHSYPVVDDEGRLMGLLTCNDLKRAMAAGLESNRLKEVASQNLVLAYPDLTLDAALIQLVRAKVSQLPVVNPTDPAKLLGMITMHDIARALARMDTKSGASTRAFPD